MDTKRIVIKNRENPADEELFEAARILKEGGLVAFPTETVYGLGGNALDGDAARRIYEAKGRPSDNPLIAHISSMEELAPLVSRIPEAGQILAEKFWPGPLTMIFPKSDQVPLSTTGGLDTVAVRMPDDPVAQKLIRLAGVPVAAPSANTSGRPSPTTADHVWQDLNGKIEMIVDGGPVGIGVESTIVDVTGPVPVILRPGFITQEMLDELFGHVEMDPAITGPMKEGIHPKAPGMKYRHYAPRADLAVVEKQPLQPGFPDNGGPGKKLGPGSGKLLHGLAGEPPGRGERKGRVPGGRYLYGGDPGRIYCGSEEEHRTPLQCGFRGP